MFVDRFTDNQGRLFLKYFLIDTSKNDRGWAVTPDAIDTFVETFKGKPVTLMRNKEESLFGDYHPFSPNINSPVSDDIQFAEKYAVGHIVDVVPAAPERLSAYSGGDPHYKSYEAIWEVEDPIAKAELLKEDTKLIPPAVSPGIVWFTGSRDHVEQFTGVHLALVPEGAYGLRAKQIAKCEGGPVQCRTELLAASYPSYEMRTGGCPLSAFSSLVNDSASSNTESMSVSNYHASPQGNVPTPRTIGTNTLRGPTGNVMATQTSTASGVNNAPTQQAPKKLQLRLKDPKRFLVNKQPSQEEEENKLKVATMEGQPTEALKQEVKPQEAPVAEAAPEATGKIDPGVAKELDELRKTSAAQERRWHLSNIIPRELFVDSNKRFRQKDWQAAIDDAISKNLPDDIIVELYQLKMKQLQYPEIQVQAKKTPSTGRLGASTQTTTNADSSQDNAETDSVVKCLRLMRGFN